MAAVLRDINIKLQGTASLFCPSFISLLCALMKN